VKIMCCDETNASPSKNVNFFVYGGLVVDADQLGPLSEDIAAIRIKSGFGADDSLKFRTASRPEALDRDEWTNSKSKTIKSCREHGAKFIACLILHQIAKGGAKETSTWQLNTCAEEFNRRLTNESDYGMVIIDRVADHREYKLLGKIFRTGGETPWGENREFTRIVSYSSTSDGASHLASATDIVLGSFAHCINHVDDETLRCRDLFKSLEQLFTESPEYSASSKNWEGLIFSPATVKIPKYSQQYEELKSYLSRLSSS